MLASQSPNYQDGLSELRAVILWPKARRCCGRATHGSGGPSKNGGRCRRPDSRHTGADELPRTTRPARNIDREPGARGRSEFGGRIIDTAGDGILAEFSSVVNARMDREAYSGLHRVWVIIEGAASYHAYPFTVSAVGKFTANGTRSHALSPRR